MGSDTKVDIVPDLLTEIRNILSGSGIDISVGDIEIGAVEIKDGTTDNRLTVEIDGSKYALYVQSASLAQEDTLSTLAGKDFATQTTLATLLKESIFTDRLGEVQASPTANTVLDRLKTIGAKDFATQTTLATLLADATFTGRLGEVQASPTANTLLARLKSLEDKTGEVQATPTTYTVLDRLKSVGTYTSYLTNQMQRITTAPVTGMKSVTTSAAEIYAGASNRLASRFCMIITNEGSVEIRVGPSGVTTATGARILPGDSKPFYFLTSTATAIYAIAASTNANISVEEYA